ncbi:spermidine synthase [Arcanobacterium wilhelmae]|uniref:Spermidine synthase n=1 Tax=Arcanobacterium wilhelmae TaxID=1803177 RepID=A0ABT9N982_9ACTO|nr:fused MFS/spermidine synthase [Arcanobacterium wilhelmae]MDP9800261.1 spermidine synthase [Arcanobacterium wilhelmae]WFN89700.1 fused MFS/spermidine synthase [Arcanobacterium wilhelmae]
METITATTAMSELRVEPVPGTSLVTLYIDDAESSALDLADPTHLEFEYMQQMRVAIDTTFDAGAPLRILHLGGAGCAFARALDAERKNSRQLAIEIDPQLATLAREWFDLPSSPRLRIRSEDARRTLDTNKGSWHVIVRDAFRRARVPMQLATVESYAAASRLLADGGLYLVNVAGGSLTDVYREVAAALESFEYIVGITDPAIARGKRHGNVVLVTSNAALDVAEIDRLVRRLSLPTTVVGQKVLEKAARSASPLTDGAVGWPFE